MAKEFFPLKLKEFQETQYLRVTDLVVVLRTDWKRDQRYVGWFRWHLLNAISKVLGP